MPITTEQALKIAILLAGWGTLLLVIVSPAIPVILKWREDTSKLRPLTRQVFWTYAVYIWLTNLWFAIMSILAVPHLKNKSLLALSLTGYMAAYWTGRVWVQFFYLDKTDAPPGMLNKLAEVSLTALFIFLMLTYAAATAWNLGWI